MTFMQQSLGQIAREVPGATDVFHDYKLDFCCGGAHTLQEAAAKKGLDAAPIAARLAQLVSQAEVAPRQWADEDMPELVDHIQSYFHARHREQLPELARLAKRVEAVHREHPACPLGLTKLLTEMNSELASHMEREESILFPLLKAHEYNASQGPIQVMLTEHNHHGENLERVEALTQDMTPPPGACNTWQALYLGLRAFRKDLMAHIHLENNVLFDQARVAA
ncbi:regulator of cell morphogenesis and NO signaling [Aquabacterium sp. NJ1]|uniref:iron-sulfur cluster repair protein YtfE n=1 Tax=Aquabacterium sp. NJ1 TaxID=1538295 RepID=UPI00052D464D|nr:iron-sulfur cluster repair protein YtfE [Aquabacterium sp. NJ1]KGM40301.1 regulator of cell morphogenesis and NO signaling [Aquabacterium sp. NJ1]